MPSPLYVTRAEDTWTALRSGVGVAALPSFLAAQDTELVRLAASTPAPVRELWLIVHADLRRAPAIEAVMGFVTALVTQSGAFSPAP